jgi:hypothetical protein
MDFGAAYRGRADPRNASDGVQPSVGVMHLPKPDEEPTKAEAAS